MLNHKISAGLLLALLAGCEAPQSSDVKDRWDSANNPVTMMATDNSFETSYDALPKSGRPALAPWSDNYWPTYQGGVGYRWNAENSRELSRLESKSTDRLYRGQLDENPELQKLRSEVYGYTPYTKEQLLAMPEAEREATIRSLSPAEKYDIYRGDFEYTTLKSERARTGILQTLRDQPDYKKDKKIETWFGICHAWAPATIMFKEPAAISVETKDNIKVDFGASDVKALLSHMIDVDDNVTRYNSFMGVRCDSDISQTNVSKLDKEWFETLEAKNNAHVEQAIEKLLKETSIDVAIKVGMLPYILAYSDSVEYAQKRFGEVSTNLRRYVRDRVRADFETAYNRAPAILALAGTGTLTPAERLAGLQEAMRTTGCSDTNAGAFHLVLANIVGLQKQSFVVDITRDREVWNQAVAGYTSREIRTLTGDKISKTAAPGTVKEVEIATTFYYTGEMNPAWEPFGNGTDLDKRYHLPQSYRYKIEIDSNGNIIGGSWISDLRPDFLWDAANPVFSPEFRDLKKLYYKAIQP
ncbi:MAG TPA: hypothetical protein VE954_20590 [Oligoflexus sp.]|uniref:hypothetical protein n=1 Tax=Oligoflexus sp. TaxID=1971216 RepID=UPI002D57C46C|nr:hypothetical protein [Oligoflexus sp.]HYX35501.1 hypothetical protein [Oligoflexus sp.]